MAIELAHTATVQAPAGAVDLAGWLAALTDDEYQRCSPDHRAAGSSEGPDGRQVVNVESIGGHLLVQHYRVRRATRSSVELHSPASRAYLLHLLPVTCEVWWSLRVTAVDERTCELSCTVRTGMPAALELSGRLLAVRHFLAAHVRGETEGFARSLERRGVG